MGRSALYRATLDKSKEIAPLRAGVVYSALPTVGLWTKRKASLFGIVGAWEASRRKRPATPLRRPKPPDRPSLPRAAGPAHQLPVVRLLLGDVCADVPRRAGWRGRGGAGPQPRAGPGDHRHPDDAGIQDQGQPHGGG